MVYLDNAATGFPKPREVTAAVGECIKKYCGNPGRSMHRLARIAGEEVYAAREAVSRFFGADDPEEVVFTLNATYALNTAIKTTIPDGGEVLISDLEHNAVYRPLKAEERRRGIKIRTFDTDGNIETNIRAALTADTCALVSTLRSNVTGKEIPLAVLSKIAREKGLILIADASQSAGHDRIDLAKTPCDILCAPGHKGLLGIQGCGFAVFHDKRRRDSFIEGGSGSASASPDMPDLLPERFEAGTLPTPAIVALRHGIEWIERYGIDHVHDRLQRLTKYAKESISQISEVSYCKGDGGILSFRIRGEDPSLTAERLDRAGICVRSGLHCAPLAHRKEGTLEGGTVRIGFSVFSCEKDVDRLLHVIR